MTTVVDCREFSKRECSKYDNKDVLSPDEELMLQPAEDLRRNHIYETLGFIFEGVLLNFENGWSDEVSKSKAQDSHEEVNLA